MISFDGLHLLVDAMLDTGFTEFLAINKQDLDALEWHFIREEELQTAQGKSIFDLYTSKVLLARQEYEIPVFAGDEITEILLGSQWLQILPLVVNYQADLLTLG